MDKKRFIYWGILGLVVFGLGVGAALWQGKKAESPQVLSDDMSASTPSSASSSVPLTPLPTIEAGKIIPEAPDMPTPAAATPPTVRDIPAAPVPSSRVPPGPEVETP